MAANLTHHEMFNNTTKKSILIAKQTFLASGTSMQQQFNDQHAFRREVINQ